MIPKILIALLALAGLGTGVYLLGAGGTENQEQVVAVSQAEIVTPPTPKTLLNPDEFVRFITKTNELLIDVRTPEEFAAGHLPGAQNIDFYTDSFDAHIAALDREASYALYCRTGNRSGQTLTRMQSLGFQNVVDLSGGIVAWQAMDKSLCVDC